MVLGHTSTDLHWFLGLLAFALALYITIKERKR